MKKLLHEIELFLWFVIIITIIGVIVLDKIGEL